MTVRGRVTPGMACGSRPVKGNPQLGAFPAGWQIAIADQGRHGPTRVSNHRNRPEQTPPLPSPWKKGEGEEQLHRELRLSYREQSIACLLPLSKGEVGWGSKQQEERWIRLRMSGCLRSGQMAPEAEAAHCSGAGTAPQCRPGRQKAGAPRPLKATILRRPHLVGLS